MNIYSPLQQNESRITWLKEIASKIKNIPDKTNVGSCWWLLSCHPNVTWELIKEFPEYPWCLCSFSKSPNLTWNIIVENQDVNWNWYFISANPNITFEIIRDNPDKPWKWDWVSKNPNITWDIVLHYSSIPWNYDNIQKAKEKACKCCANKCPTSEITSSKHFTLENLLGENI